MGPKRSAGEEAGKGGGAGSSSASPAARGTGLEQARQSCWGTDRAQGQQPGLQPPPDLSLVACFRVFPSRSNASCPMSWLPVPAPCSGCWRGASTPQHRPSVQKGPWGRTDAEPGDLSPQTGGRSEVPPPALFQTVKASGGGKQGKRSPPSLSGAAEERTSCCREPAQPATAPARPGRAARQTPFLVPSSQSELFSPGTARQEGSRSRWPPPALRRELLSHARIHPSAGQADPRQVDTGARRSPVPRGRCYFPAATGLRRAALAACLFTHLPLAAHMGKIPSVLPAAMGGTWEQG